MTFLEAQDAIDKELTMLDVKDIFGEKCVGVEAFAYVAKMIGPRFDKPVDDLYAGLTSPEEYAKSMIAMIQECAPMKQMRRIERRLKELDLDQIELDLLGRTDEQ